tara:strand:- start:944 stop:1240 length:297 start_codon:yes stop_codon:yes gene_type:complete
MAQLRAASKAHGWALPLAELAKIWRGGCIIRAHVLSLVHAAFERQPELPNLLLDPEIAKEVASRADLWRSLVALAVQYGVPVPALSSSLVCHRGLEPY